MIDIDTNSEEWRHICEARDLVRKYKANGRNWWKTYKAALIKRRGQESVDKLLITMERERKL